METTIIPHKGGGPIINMAIMPRVVKVMSKSAMMMVFFRSHRSANTPANGIIRMGGIFIIMIIRAYRETLPVVKVIRYQIRANDTIWDPKIEKLCPIKIKRYCE